MSNRTGRVVRRALAAIVGLGGLGIYATAQQPKPLIIKSTGTPGVYAVSDSDTAPNRPADALPGVPVPTVADTPITRDSLPVAPVMKTGILPGVPLPLPEAAVARDAMPLAPTAPSSPGQVTPVGLAVPQGPLAPLPPAPISATNPASQQPPVVVVPPAPPEPTRSPRMAVEPTSAPVNPEAPTAPPVLLAPVPAPEPPPLTPLPATLGTGAFPAMPAVPQPAVIPNIRTPIITAPIRYRNTGTIASTPSASPSNASTVQAAPGVTSVPSATPTIVTENTSPNPVGTHSASATSSGKCATCSPVRVRSHGGCCVCAPATVPPPVGTAVRTAFGTQRANGLEEYCVVFREDFDQGTDTLNPTGERHIAGIARRFNQTHANVKIEPTGDAPLDQRRTAAVISELTKAGIPAEAASARVQVGNTRSEGMQAPDIEATNVRHALGNAGIVNLAPTYGGFATFGPLGPYAYPWR